MKNNPFKNNPFHITVNGKITKADLGGRGYGIRNRLTNEYQYHIPIIKKDLESRSNFLYQALLKYAGTIFDLDEKSLKKKIKEDDDIIMGITIFPQKSNLHKYILVANYFNHRHPQLQIEVLLDDDERKLINNLLTKMESQVDEAEVVAHGYV